MIQQRLEISNKIEEEPENEKKEILSESDMGSELDDELFRIEDIRKTDKKSQSSLLGANARNWNSSSTRTSWTKSTI